MDQRFRVLPGSGCDMNHGLTETRTRREDKLERTNSESRGEKRESRSTHLNRNLIAHLANGGLEQRLQGPARAGRRLRCDDS